MRDHLKEKGDKTHALTLTWWEMRPWSTLYHEQSFTPIIWQGPEPPNESNEDTQAMATFTPPQNLQQVDAITMHTFNRATHPFIRPLATSFLFSPHRIFPGGWLQPLLSLARWRCWCCLLPAFHHLFCCFSPIILATPATLASSQRGSFFRAYQLNVPWAT